MATFPHQGSYKCLRAEGGSIPQGAVVRRCGVVGGMRLMNNAGTETAKQTVSAVSESPMSTTISRQSVSPSVLNSPLANSTTPSTSQSSYAPGTIHTSVQSKTDGEVHSEVLSNVPEDNQGMRWSPATTLHAGPASLELPFLEASELRDATCPPPLKCSRCIPLPSQCDSEGEVTLHPLLHSPVDAGLHWELAGSHDGVGKMTIEDHWRSLKELATTPAIPSMTVVHQWLPWPITIHASGMDSRGVTVADVLVTISQNMLLPVEGTKSRIRMDFLQGQRIFLGLESSEIGGDIWELMAG